MVPWFTVVRPSQFASLQDEKKTAVTNRRRSQLCTAVVHSELERGGASGNVRISQPEALAGVR